MIASGNANEYYEIYDAQIPRRREIEKLIRTENLARKSCYKVI